MYLSVWNLNKTNSVCSYHHYVWIGGIDDYRIKGLDKRKTLC
jgi:hypothetical protein